MTGIVELQLPNDVEGNFNLGAEAGAEPLADVAKLCGVTPALVVRLLNGEQMYSVTDAVRTKVVNAAQARICRRHRTRSHASPHAGDRTVSAPPTRFAEGLYESQIDGVSDVLHVCRYNVFIELSSAGQDEHQLASWRFDGAILMQRPKPETVAELDRRRVPYVCVNEPRRQSRCICVGGRRDGHEPLDRAPGEAGHQRLAYANARATYLDHGSVTERYAAFLDRRSKRCLHVADGHDVPFSSPRDFLSRHSRSPARDRDYHVRSSHRRRAGGSRERSCRCGFPKTSAWSVSTMCFPSTCCPRR